MYCIGQKPPKESSFSFSSRELHNARGDRDWPSGLSVAQNLLFCPLTPEFKRYPVSGSTWHCWHLCPGPHARDLPSWRFWPSEEVGKPKWAKLAVHVDRCYAGFWGCHWETPVLNKSPQGAQSKCYLSWDLKDEKARVVSGEQGTFAGRRESVSRGSESSLLPASLVPAVSSMSWSSAVASVLAPHCISIALLPLKSFSVVSMILQNKMKSTPYVPPVWADPCLFVICTFCLLLTQRTPAPWLPYFSHPPPESFLIQSCGIPLSHKTLFISFVALTTI